MRETRVRNNQRRGRSRVRSTVTMLQVLILLGISGSVGTALGLFINLSNILPDVAEYEPAEATVIYSADNVILGRIFREDRTNVSINKIPEELRNATVAIEDSRFYHHAGVDLRGIARAIWQNVRGQRLAQGGSTITQQLARNVYLTQRKTFQRKIQEAVLAIMLERNFPKDKILEMYLNQVYYGSGAFGVQAASRIYFGKDVDQLDLSEAALLAGLPQKPSVYSPHENFDQAIERRNVVLNRMRELGYLTAGECEDAKTYDIDIITKRRGRESYKAPHFVDYIARQLRERYGDDILFRGGLKVHTTLHYGMQKAAEEALRKGVKKYEGSYRVTEGCFICIEPGNGYVRAMVGSVDPASFLNRTTQALRQPGSSFKAFVYTAAMEAGMKPSDRIVDERVSYPSGTGKPWRPKNYDNAYRGSVTLKYAVAKSINIPAIKVAEKVGIENVIKYARLMGINAELEPFLSTAIGGIKGVHPIEMASAYGTFANDGVYVESCSIIKVENNRGDILEDYVPEGKRVISQRTCKYIDEMLRAVVTMGTGTRARSITEARGKTGTTNEDRDAWWIGYVPHKLVAACWVGNDDYSSMRSAYGGTVCAPIWVEFMKSAVPMYDDIDRQARKTTSKSERKKSDIDSKDNTQKRDGENDDRRNREEDADRDSEVVSVKVCDESGLVAGSSCPSWHTQRLIRGSEPTEQCTMHDGGEADVEDNPRENNQGRRADSSDVTLVTVTVCPESGLLATPSCPNSTSKRLPADQVPGSECNLHGRNRAR